MKRASSLRPCQADTFARSEFELSRRPVSFPSGFSSPLEELKPNKNKPPAGIVAPTRRQFVIGASLAALASQVGTAPGALAARPKRRLIITIDVEALPAGRPSNHVDTLIWGRFDGKEMGIGRIMAIANRYNVPLTFFVDLCETALYPGAFEQ